MEQPINKDEINIEEEQGLVASNSVYGFLRSGSKFFVSFLISVLLVRFLGPTNYGYYTVVVLYWGFASTMAGLGINSAVQYAISKYRAQNSASRLMWAVKHYLVIVILSSLVASIVLFSLSGVIASIYHSAEVGYLIKILAFGLVFYSLSSNFTEPSFIGFQKMNNSFITGVLYDFLRIIQLVVIYLGFGLIGAIKFYDVVYLVTATVGLFLLYRSMKGFPKSAKPEKQDLSHFYSYRNFSYVMAIISLSYGPVIALFLGAVAPNISSVSFYRVGLIMAGMLGLPAAAVGSAFFASITKFFERKQFEGFYRLQRSLIKYSFLLTFPLVTASIISAPKLISYLYKASFIGAETPFIILLVPVLISSIFGPVTQVLSATGKQKYAMYSVITGAVVGIALTLILVPILYAVGAAFAYLAVTLSTLSVNLILVSRYIKIKLPYLELLKATVSVVLMGLFLYFLLIFVKRLAYLPLLLIASLAFYALMLYVTKTISNKELRFIIKLFKADKFVKIFYKKY
jgi:O-antigen/teichoic acid export membrane protein